jgi:hypothetical protein
MTTRTFIDKNGNEWIWEETEEVLQSLKELYNENETNSQTTTVD